MNIDLNSFNNRTQNSNKQCFKTKSYAHGRDLGQIFGAARFMAMGIILIIITYKDPYKNVSVFIENLGLLITPNHPPHEFRLWLYLYINTVSG